MHQVLEPGQSVTTSTTGLVCLVRRFVGGGGQGEVYEAELEGKPVALKWYFPAAATPQQRAALEILVEKGPPNDKFLWPLELASAQGVPGFGYVMPLRPPHYRGIVDLMKRRTEPGFRALATAGLKLSHSFLQLHAKGLCYRDISFGNVFFDPATGDILVCDNDNVTVDGTEIGGVLGTPRFMAPEVVRGDAPPSTQTDLFSLAVLLFYMLMVHHPLEGKKELEINCFDLPAMTQLYGTAPVFIFDPDDDSNRPVRGFHDNAVEFWPIYPRFIRELFTRAFTEGIDDPEGGRVRESEWRAAMVRLRDSIVYCTDCGAESFYDIDALREAGTSGPCWSCGRAIQLPPRLRIGDDVIMLNHDTRLFPHHICEAKTYDFSQPVAALTHHPKYPDIWGLTNLTEDKWVTTTADGAMQDVQGGRSVRLAAGTRINFGQVEGEIRA